MVHFINVEYVFREIYLCATGQTCGGVGPSIFQFINAFLDLVRPFFILASLLFLAGAIYSWYELRKIRQHEELIYGHAHEPLFHPVTVSEEEAAGKRRWQKVIEHVNSENPNDWRQAIIEADIMLDELLGILRYHGDTMGDRLKAVEKSDFLSIDEAWEAHRVRNQIAHEGSDFILNQREAKRVIGLYEKAFREFHYI